MRQYNVEIFNRDIEYACNTTINEVKYKSDYLDPEKYKIDVIKDDIHDIGINYFCHIMCDDEDYIGVVNSFEEKKDGILTIEIQEISTLFDLDVMIDVNDFNYTFEEYIAKWIRALYIDGDTSMKMPFNIAINSSTPDWEIDYKIENEPGEDEEIPPIEVAFINILDDVILPAFTSHQIRLEYSIDLNRKQISIDIGKNEAEEITIEADLSNILSKSLTIREGKNVTNKVIVYNQEDYRQSVTYYLHPDDSFSTVDTDRVLPVSYKLLKCKKETDKDPDTKEEIVVRTFEEVALEKATEVMNKNKYTNLIELTMFLDDDLIRPATLKVGQKVSIISNGTRYSSILTGRQNNRTTKLIFGTIRLELTKMLKGRA